MRDRKLRERGLRAREDPLSWWAGEDGGIVFKEERFH